MRTLSKIQLRQLQRQRQVRAAAASRTRAATATRAASPVRDARAQLEPIIHPVFDTEGASTGGMTYFSRPRGQAAASGFPKTPFDTSMEQSGSLPRPRVHIVTGLRVVVSMVTGDTVASPTVNVAPNHATMAATMRAILWESVFKLVLGTKTYCEVPTHKLPGNVGLGIWGHSSIDPGTATLAQWSHGYYSRGDYYSTLSARLKIPSLQTFGATITFPVAPVNAVTACKVAVILDGIQGREVM